jgi:hypothetical protein
VKSKNLIILAAVVIAVLAYILIFERHQPTTEEARKEADKVLHDFDRDDVQAIEIESESGHVRLERVGEQWRLRAPFDFPADSSTVSSTLGSLANLTADRRIAVEEIEPAEYGLDDPAAEVTLEMAGGGERSIAVGDELPLGSKRALLIDGGDEVIIASGWFVNDLERKTDDWRSRDVIDFLEDDVASIDIEAGTDTIRAVRVDDRWRLLRPLEDLADDDHLGGLISDLRSMRIEEFLDDVADLGELGLDLPGYSITVVRSDGGEPLRLDLGDTREGENDTEVACRRGDGAVFWASERVLTRLSKAPVLWRAKKVMPFETWDVREVRITAPEESAILIHEDGLWHFEDDSEADLAKVQERLRSLADLEATDYDLMTPITSEMGRVEVVLEEKEGEERPLLVFSFHAPLEEGGKAMVQVTGRDTVMGVEVEDVEAVLENLDQLRPEPPEESDAESN